jgi:nitrite reductase/ring-hydroxylating ferredoxin subunit
VPRLRASRSAPDGEAAVVSADTAKELVPLGPAIELARRKRQVVAVGGLELLVVFGRRRFTVMENRCPHLGTRLDSSRIGRYTLTCPAHSFRYSLASGAYDPGPRCRPVQGGRLTLFPTRIENGCLYAIVGRALLTGSGRLEAS